MGRTIRRVLRNPRVVASCLVIVVVGAAALSAPWLAPKNPYEQDFLNNLNGPSDTYLLGTDEYGRDVLSRLIYGAQVSLLIAVGAVAIALSLGLAIGLVGAHYGGWVETVTMRLVDVLLSLPPILFAMAAVAFLGSSMTNLVLIIGVLYAPRFARVVHAAAVSERRREYIDAQRALGAGTLRIIARGILPNILAPVMVQTSLSLGFAILLESGLSFLGLGAPPPRPSWGNMIATARGYLRQSPLLVVWPSLAIGLTILAFNTLGDGLRDELDPRGDKSRR